MEEEKKTKKKNKVRIVMDVEPSVKAELEENAKKCGFSLTLYLEYCGLHKQPKAMPPASIVKAKNMLCDFRSAIMFCEGHIDDYVRIDPYLKHCNKLAADMDRLLLDYQS